MTTSPFPGMDPFLEVHWRSVHHRLITYLGDQLQSLLPQSFRVEVEERVFVSGESDIKRIVAPDVYVTHRSGSQSDLPNTLAACAAPVVVEIVDEPITEAYLEIVDLASGEKVISAIELLSPSNKTAGDGNDLYVDKQREYRLGKVNQVEIDLTRSGDRSLVFPMNFIPSAHQATYLACVRRASTPSKIEVYPMPLSQRLPILSVPLTSSQRDVPLDLQSAIDACYRNGRYADIDYSQALRPALSGADEAWCIEQLEKFRARR